MANVQNNTRKINCIIVDDEPVARDLLVRYVGDVPALRLAAVCSNAFEASEALLAGEVHLIFLDINMPRLSGMQFYRSLARPPAVIFTTAYPQYALEGFEVDAADYLLKPFSFERFYQAVSRVMARLPAPGGNPDPGHIILRSDRKLHRVRLSEIVAIEGLGDYVKVHLGASFLVVHDTLTNLSEVLPGNFQRVHRSWLVSADHIRCVEGNTIETGNLEVPIGMTYREAFREWLESRGPEGR